MNQSTDKINMTGSEHDLIRNSTQNIFIPLRQRNHLSNVNSLNDQIQNSDINNRYTGNSSIDHQDWNNRDLNGPLQ